MKRLLIIVPALALISATPFLALAKEDATSTHPIGIDARESDGTFNTPKGLPRGEAETRKVEVKKMVEEKKAEIKVIKGEFRAEKAKGLVARAVDELTRTADRLTKLADRIASRITKVKAAGGDTTKAEVSLAAARADIATARTQITAISSIDLTVSSGTASTTIRANFEKVKTAANAVKATFKSAKTNLELSVSSIKGPHATSTATTTKSN